MKILITGGSGTIARNLFRLFKNNEEFKLTCASKNELNLLDRKSCEDYLYKLSPDIVIHTAIEGGIKPNIDSERIIENNVKMYENLMSYVKDDIKVITFGSGAEFDRRNDINCVLEYDQDKYFPLDPYGISKSIITRQALQDSREVYVLRLFGCFGYDDRESRFINKCISNIKSNIPIEIHQDRLMDFFYINDVFNVINHIIHCGGHKHINLTYYEKYSLLNIATIILQSINKPNYPIVINNPTMGLSYTGENIRLESMGIKLIGLKQGILETCKKLLE